jgi:cytochrome c peroxidase
MGNRAIVLTVAGGLCWAAALGLFLAAPAASEDHTDPNMMAFANAAGQMQTFSRGAINRAHPFFQELGRNGRRCVTCHEPEAAWTITPELVQRRFDESQGMDPLFRANDGSNCEGALPGTQDESRAAYSLLLSRGLIRVGLDIPDNAEFVVETVDDPHQCAYASHDISVYRRPLPTANVRFVSAVMWDGRESTATSTIREDLMRQANSATRGHAEALGDLTLQQARQIADLQMGIHSAQSRDNGSGNLRTGGATGGPSHLSRQPFFIGINDPVGMNPSAAPFAPRVFTLFDRWMTAKGDQVSEYRRAIARGQEIFNTKPITLTGVSGLNGQIFPSGVAVPDSLTGTCTVCHDTPNVGNHSVKAPLNIGLDDPDVAPYLPVYTLRHVETGARVRTTDPGRALISGKWQDIGRFKGPTLRALAARPPYFHNGSAATLEEVVEFYDRRFAIGLTPLEKADLVAFLKAL